MTEAEIVFAEAVKTINELQARLCNLAVEHARLKAEIEARKSADQKLDIGPQ